MGPKQRISQQVNGNTLNKGSDLILRIEESARERRKSREGGSIRESTESAANDVELESLLDDPAENGSVEDTEVEQREVSKNVEDEANDVEEEIPIEIPLEDLPVSRTEEEEGTVVTKTEPDETSGATSEEQVIERPLERVPIEPPPCPAADPQRRLTEDDPNMDSMDRLRRDLEKLANKGRGSGTEARPLRKTGPEDNGGGEEELGETEVKQEGTWYCKPPMSPELLIAIAVRNLDPHKEVSCQYVNSILTVEKVGASCSDIVAFISLHFPYFNNNYEECKVQTRQTIIDNLLITMHLIIWGSCACMSFPNLIFAILYLFSLILSIGNSSFMNPSLRIW